MSVKLFFGAVALAFLWNLAYAVWKIRQIRRSGRTVMARAPEGALFTQRWVSGGSALSLWTRLGAARNCLFVAVTRDRLLIRPQFPFNLFAGGFDLDHDVLLNEVQVLETRGARVRLRLPGRTFTLHLRRPRDFLSQIPGGRASEPR